MRNTDVRVHARRRGFAVGGTLTVMVFAGGAVLPAAAGTSVPTPVPTVTSVSPGGGPLSGGNTVDVKGTGFLFSGTTPPSVNFNYASGTNVNVISDEELTVTAPSNPAGTVHVTVSNTVGTSQPTPLDDYAYIAVSSVSPPNGGTNGNTTVTINGGGFTNATGVQFAGVSALSFSVLSDTQISAVTPPYATATGVSVSVAVAGGVGSCGACFTYQEGYWLFNSAGHVYPFGQAVDYGSPTVTANVVGAAATPDGKGYWEVSSDGNVYAQGDAHLFGNMLGAKVNKPMVGIEDTADGNGYWLVAADGGVFPFGDAAQPWLGSLGNCSTCHPVVALARTPDGGGYWIEENNGGVWPYGDAQGKGSAANCGTCHPFAAMAPSPSGQGYWLMENNGGTWPYGDAVGYGSAAGCACHPFVSMASTADGRGYWLEESNGGIWPYGDAVGIGSEGGCGSPCGTFVSVVVLP